MVKQQMHYLGSSSDKWPMYGWEQFLTKETLAERRRRVAKEGNSIDIPGLSGFRVFFPTYLAAVRLLVNFHSWEHPQPNPSCFFICKNFPSWRGDVHAPVFPFFSIANSASFLSLHTFSPLWEFAGQIVGLIHLWIRELSGWQFNPSRQSIQPQLKRKDN